MLDWLRRALDIPSQPEPCSGGPVFGVVRSIGKTLYNDDLYSVAIGFTDRCGDYRGSGHIIVSKPYGDRLRIGGRITVIADEQQGGSL